MAARVFVTGGTGYLGRALIPALVARGHAVTALVRPGSEAKLPRGARAVIGDALQHGAWEREIERGSTFVHLIGTPHPSPSKAREFERVDLRSIEVAVEAARDAGVAYFVYLSVAQPAPIMRAYVTVRARGEELVRASGLDATLVRPWYVLGPGHRWPLALLPFYWCAERLPATRDGARRLALVTLDEVTRALVSTIEEPPRGVRLLDVPAIRGLRSRSP